MQLISQPLGRQAKKAWFAFRVLTTIAVILHGSCFFDTKTTLCKSVDLRCRENETCAANQAVCIPIGGCGDGIPSPSNGEVCDDGNNIDLDGCSASCRSDERCGNGFIDLTKGETCDDGNTLDGDGCPSDCREAFCGNSIVERARGETCDDGNAESGDGCNSTCTSNEACGNAILDTELAEECDPLKTFPQAAQNHPDCDSDCTAPACGDGHFNPLHLDPEGRQEECDTGGDTFTCNEDCTLAVCGDGHRNQAAGEDCDPPGAPGDTPTCDNDCTLPRCGDKHTNPHFRPIVPGPFEECDDGDNSATCDSDCTRPRCGDDHHNPSFRVPGESHTEECDDGEDNNDQLPNRCRENCRRPFCGDGVTDSDNNEDCDNSGCLGFAVCDQNCMCVVED